MNMYYLKGYMAADQRREPLRFIYLFILLLSIGRGPKKQKHWKKYFVECVTSKRLRALKLL